MCTETENQAPVQPATAQTPRVVRRVQPRVDICELGDHFEIVADVPGVEQEGVSLKIDGDSLHLEAAATSDSQHPAIKRPYQQLHYARTFTLGRQVEREGIAAELKHGVLRVTLPKVKDALPRQISVRVSGDVPKNN